MAVTWRRVSLTRLCGETGLSVPVSPRVAKVSKMSSAFRLVGCVAGRPHVHTAACAAYTYAASATPSVSNTVTVVIIALVSVAGRAALRFPSPTRKFGPGSSGAP